MCFPFLCKFNFLRKYSVGLSSQKICAWLLDEIAVQDSSAFIATFPKSSRDRIWGIPMRESTRAKSSFHTAFHWVSASLVVTVHDAIRGICRVSATSAQFLSTHSADSVPDSVARHINSCERKFNKRKDNHSIMKFCSANVSARPVVHVSSRDFSVIALLTFSRARAIFKKSWTIPRKVVLLTFWSVFSGLL